MTLVLADAEKLVRDYLVTVTGVTALVDTRVSAALPPEPTWPYLTLSRVGGVPSLPGYLDNPHIEFYAWAETKGAARALAAAVGAAMTAITGSHTLGTVTGAFDTGDGLRWDPDEATNCPRYSFTWQLFIFPAAAP